MKQLIWIALLGTAGLLAGCDQGAPPLPGERVDVRPQEDVATNEDGSRVQVSVPIALPAPVNHAQWTHRGGSALHKVTHPALGASLVRVWSADIGSGNSKRYRISADPVVAEGRIYTLDSRAGVMAHSLTGKTLWSVDATPASDNNTDATGGGLAFGAGRLFVTTGFGELLALDPATGDVIWRQSFDASVSGAPTVQDDMVYVMARDNAAFAVRADNGRLAWTLPGAPSGSEMLSGAGPAVTERAAIFPSGNSELVAALTESGVRSWVASIAGERRGRAYATVSDISSDPVVVGNVVYAGSQSGRFAALSLVDGSRLWTATEGAYSPGWPVGGSVFITSDQGQLVRLDANDGQVIWAVDLPYFKKEKVTRRKAVHEHYGPVLAGGRLIVASDDGLIRSFNPADGALISEVTLPGGAASLPAIVNGTLYILSGNGQLHAFR